MVPAPIVEFRDVSKRFGDGPPVLDRIGIEAQQGDFISIVGPSGCGKSTLLRLIAGLTGSSSGTVTIDGKSPDQASAELAFVFQEPTLLPWSTVSGNVALAQRLRGLPAGQRESAVKQALRLVGLGEKAGFYPRQLSGGQKMRVSLARAFTLSPRILLLDEPFGALDELTREHLNEELLAIRQVQGWSAFFVTHSVAEAVFLSNRVLVMSPAPGRIHTEVPIDLPYPRTAETRLSRAFQDHVANLSRLLRSVEKAA